MTRPPPPIDPDTGALRSTATCRSCGAPIAWCWSSGGKLQPVDPDPAPNGNLEVTIAAKGPHAGEREAHVRPADLLGGHRYIGHHATCPDGKEWRRR